MVVLTDARKPPEGYVSVQGPTCLELFAGAGGLALGLQSAGFVARSIVELDTRAVESLRLNAPNGDPWPVVSADVRGLRFDTFGDVDLLAGGPPCQPFSIGGLRRGRHDDRDLLPEAIRAIRESRPKTFLIENVRGLTFPAARDYFEYSLAQLRHPSVPIRGTDEPRHLRELLAIPEDRQEYRVTWRLLNAADFGVPQQRVRLFIIGIRRDLPAWEWPVPTHSQTALLQALMGETYWDDHRVARDVRTLARENAMRAKSQTAERSSGSEPWITVRDVFDRLGPPGSRDGDVAHVEVAGARLYRKHKGSLLDFPAKTVKSGVHGTPGGEHIVVLDDGSHRYFTLRELAAFQTFPDEYRVPSLRSVAHRQLGNAVPVKLARALARQLFPLVSSQQGDSSGGG